MRRAGPLLGNARGVVDVTSLVVRRSEPMMTERGEGGRVCALLEVGTTAQSTRGGPRCSATAMPTTLWSVLPTSAQGRIVVSVALPSWTMRALTHHHMPNVGTVYGSVRRAPLGAGRNRPRASALGWDGGCVSEAGRASASGQTRLQSYPSGW